jgi:hypothetical protein
MPALCRGRCRRPMVSGPAILPGFPDRRTAAGAPGTSNAMAAEQRSGGDGAPAAGWLVRLDSATDPREPSAHTGGDGWVEFRGLSQGPWTVRAETPEFEGMSRDERRTEPARREGIREVGVVRVGGGEKELRLQGTVER